MNKSNQEQNKMLGLMILKARKKSGYSQQHIADFLGVARQTIGCWERGENAPDGLTLMRLMLKINMDHEELKEEAPPKDRMEEILERLEKLEKKQLVTA